MIDTRQPAIRLCDDRSPKVGLHHAVDFPTYAAWPLVNSSAVKAGMQSMLRMRAVIDGTLDDDDTTSRKFGRAVHCRLLEPDLFPIRFSVASPCEAILASGNREGQFCGKSSKYLADGMWFCGSHKNDAELVEDFISVEENANIDRMIESIQRHDAVNLLRSHGGCEVSGVADIFGVRFKMRADKLLEGKSCPPTIVDIKKCQTGKIGKDQCESAIKNYAYHRQAAIYKMGFDAITGLNHAFIWVFIEEKPPFDINVIRMDERTFQIGQHEVRLVLEAWKEAVEKDEYPGVSSHIEDGGLPEWEQRKWDHWNFEVQDNGGNTTDDATDGTDIDILF